MSVEPQPGRKHILTIVVEDYFQVGAFSHLIPSGYWGRFETNLKRNTESALELLEDTGSRATFFSCGWIADNHPQVLRRIVDCGHEVACQGYFHNRIGDLPPVEFARDVRRSRHAVEDATGQAVRGFRIGHGWIGSEDLWALDILAEAGFSYDSSARVPAGDVLHSVVHHYATTTGSLYEVPVSSLPVMGLPLLMSGGNYLRQFPDWLLRPGVEKWIETNEDPLVLYFHSWELEPDQPRIAAASFLQRLRHYRNLAGMPEKLRYYLERYDFTSVAEYLDLRLEPVAPSSREESPAETWVPEVRSGAARVPLTLVIPCYNEAETLPYLEKTLQRFAEKGAALFDLYYVLVDDGSSDETWKLLQQRFGERDRFRLVRHDVNKGIAAALVTGFRLVRTEFLAALDADCTFAPDQLFEMMSLMTDDTDVVVASPAHAQGAMHAVPAWRSLLSRGSAFMYRCVLRHKLTSYTSCFRLYRQRAIQGITVYDPGFCGVTEILGRLDLAGCRIVEYPAVLETRLLGQSKIKIFRTILGHLRLAFRLATLRWLGRPMPEPVSAELVTSYADHDRK